jgi:putative chitinase
MISLEQFQSCVPFGKKGKLAAIYPYILQAMEEYEINTYNRVTYFLAQIIHESGSFKYLEEIASGAAYEHRKDLGNLDPLALEAAHAQGTTTGKFYKGHGYIQITGYYNHKKVGDALGIDCVNYPKLLCDIKYACLSAAWFWKTHGCNELADEGNFKAVTRKINGGLNGLADRLQNLEICRNEISL